MAWSGHVTLVELSSHPLETPVSPWEPSRFMAKPEGKQNGQEMSGVIGHAFTSSRGVMSGPSRGFVAIATEQRYDAPGT